MIKFQFNTSSENALLVKEQGVIRQLGWNSHRILPANSSNVDLSGMVGKLVDNNIANNSTVAGVSSSVTGLENIVAEGLAGNLTVLNEGITQLNDTYTAFNQSYGQKIDNINAINWYGVSLNTDGFVSGFETGTVKDMQDGTSVPSSYFKIQADKFIVGRAVDTNNEPGKDSEGNVIEYATMLKSGTNEPLPVFAIDWDSDASLYNTYFNGRVSFQNLANGDGETIVDGGLVDTDTVIADSIVLGSKQVSRHYGSFANDDEAEAWVMDNTIIASTERTPRLGDTYYNTIINDNKRCTNADGENSSWERMKGDRGSVSATLNIDVDDVKGDDHLESNSDLLDSAISDYTGLTPAVGDRVFWSNISDKALNPASGEAVLTTSGWLADVALKVHGDAIIDGTLNAGKIEANSIVAENIDYDGLSTSSLDTKSGESSITYTVNLKAKESFTLFAPVQPYDSSASDNASWELESKTSTSDISVDGYTSLGDMTGNGEAANMFTSAGKNTSTTEDGSVEFTITCNTDNVTSITGYFLLTKFRR